MKYWLDVDTGIDDAVALVLASRLFGRDLALVSGVSGNTTLPNVVENTRRVLAAVGRGDVPVVSGAERPLLRDPIHGHDVHGARGLGSLDLAESGRPPDPCGFAAIAAAVTGLGPEVTLIATGPLTNLALLAAAFPECLAGVRRTVWMGGALASGNITAAAEYNAFADPEAAAIAIRRMSPVTMVGLDVTRALRLTRSDAEALGRLSAAGRLVRDLVLDPAYQRFATADGAAVHDAVAVAEAYAPGVVLRVRRRALLVETAPGTGYGATRPGGEADPLTDVAEAADRPAFLSLLSRSLRASA